MFGWITGIKSAWELVKWARNVKKDFEKNADTFLSDERALALRLYLETTFKALEDGNGNLARLPGWVRWLLNASTADNRFGRFGWKVLKSEKLSRDDPVLRRPLGNPYRP